MYVKYQMNYLVNNKYNIIYSSDLCINNAKMIDIYSKCFMGIRLCENDGNANTVQEMGLLGLPVLHNGLYPNSVPWINNNFPFNSFV